MKLKDELKYLSDNTKGKMFIKNFRRVNYLSENKYYRIIGMPFKIYFKILFNYLLGIDIPQSTKIGYGFNVFHGQGLVISAQTIIGNFVTVRQNTTIGNAIPGGKCPIIGDNVDIGANCVIIGEITIGDNVKIGAGSVVIKSIPPNCVVVGNPARIIKMINL